MSTTRSLTKTFKIKSPIMGVPRSAYQSGIFPTRDKKLIAMLRRLPDYRVEEVVDHPGPTEIDYSDKTWHEIQKLGAEAGVLKTGMGREEIEAALRANI